MNVLNRKLLFVLAIAVLSATGSWAQIDIPRNSPNAKTVQTIGLTDVMVKYSRPKVNERVIWGELVPYEQVWRCGANENTIIKFSTDVKIEGQALAAGAYGLHMIPTSEDWTIIFSNTTTAWGSFSYNEEEDALRVTVTPQEGSHTEMLTYDFMDVADGDGTLYLSWGKLTVPIKVSTNVHDITLASIRQELRGATGFTWNSWNQAANYILNNDLDLEQGIQWADGAIQRADNFFGHQTKSNILNKMGKTEEAEKELAYGLSVATPLEMHFYGRQLIGEEKPEEALKVFKKNKQNHPDVWYTNVGMARGYQALKDNKNAIKYWKMAIPEAPENQRQFYENIVVQLEEAESSQD